MKHVIALLLALVLNPVTQCLEPGTNAELLDNQIASVRLFDLPPKVIGTTTIGRHYIEVTFSTDTAQNLADIQPSNIEIRTLPSNTQLTAIDASSSSTFFLPGSFRVVQA